MVESRWLGPTEAAAYLCLKLATFRRLVREGRIPEPSQALGGTFSRWDREELDAHMEGRQGPEVAHQAALKLVAEMVANSKKRKRQQP